MNVPLTLAALCALYVINKSGAKDFVLYLWSRIFTIRGLLPSVKGLGLGDDQQKIHFLNVNKRNFGETG